MNKAHCDICDALVEPYQRWVDVPIAENKTHVVHLKTAGGMSSRVEKDYCLACWQNILRQMLHAYDAVLK